MRILILFYSSLHVKMYFIRVKSAGHCTVSAADLLQRRPGNVRCPAGHWPMISYTDAGRRPYDM